MSSEAEENLVEVKSVDVDCSTKESISKCDTLCDSGLETIDNCSTAFPASSDSELSPLKHGNTDFDTDKFGSDQGIENESNSVCSTFSISPDIENPDIISNECLLNGGVSPTTESNISDKSEIESDRNKTFHKNHANPQSKSSEDINASLADIGTSAKQLGISSMSLNDEKVSMDTRNIICKSPLSKSFENMLYNQSEEHISKDNCLNSKVIDADRILSEFTSKKNIASATQKVVTQTYVEPQTISDTRYTRIQKEILTQDIGSIVKNVHGIFSSVSGSLMSAYTQRSVQKPVKPIVKPILNGKVMTDIFEDEKIESIETAHEEKFPELQTEVTNVETKAPENDEEKRDLLRLQVESLGKVLVELKRENGLLKERVKQQVDQQQDTDKSLKELEGKVDLMSRRVEQAEREKDAAVMRYASVECAAIEAKRLADKATSAEKAALAEVELLNTKIKSAHAEKQRICQMYDDKCHELQNCERDSTKVREDMRELEGRLKWTQSKLRVEMDAYKETSERADRLAQQVSELEAARDTNAVNATDALRAKQLEAELKEVRAALILCRHENSEMEKRLTSTSQQLECCKKERDAATAALAQSNEEVERLKQSNLRLEEEAAELAALRARAALADALTTQLQRETSRAANAEEALSLERARADTCARREAAALAHAASLTASHVRARADTHAHTAQVSALSADNAGLRARLGALVADTERLRAAAERCAERRRSETKALARKVAEVTEELAEVNKQLEWEKGENMVMKKKHASATKELNRELQRALKRCDALEAKLPHPDASSTRTGSVTSLSSSESPQEERLQNGHADPVPDIQVREPDRQTLIERIVSLQRASARRAERVEFLEEHARQLTEELRGKSRLLRRLLADLPAHAVADLSADVNKKEIARLGGGAMAAVWGGDPAGMTLELSLEMNARLQAVLEDTLLKNMTLKDNMDTLGEEIARLKGQNGATSTSK